MTATITAALRAAIDLLSATRETFDAEVILREYDDVLDKLRAALRAAQPVAYWVERRWTDPARNQTWRKYIECVSRRDAETMRTRLRRHGVTEARIVPLYAGTPEEPR